VLFYGFSILVSEPAGSERFAPRHELAGRADRRGDGAADPGREHGWWKPFRLPRFRRP
jgi:hypothetical protein